MKLVLGSKIVSLLILRLFVMDCFFNFRSRAQLLPPQEVQALEVISSKLHNRLWKVSRSSCSGGGGLNVSIAANTASNVLCDCSFDNNTVCHVTNIELKGLDLTGALPEEFAELSYLQKLDLSRNYINGSIPAAFSKIPLKNLSLSGNRISGLIPKEIGDIATLEELVLDDNLLGGPLHRNLGRLSRLRRLLLSANNITGTIPESFGNLTSLEDFRIDGSTLSGRIPDFIGNWTRIARLDMQGTSMEGPIPSSIFQLTNLTELRISDLTGSSTRFPVLQEMNNMERLILRNCLITGSIPVYIGSLSKLKTLDLSFNFLDGKIPDSIQTLNFDFLLLTNNSLSGEVPGWILRSSKNIDVSYNNFTQPSQWGCQPSRVNLISSHSSPASESISWCLRKDLPCPRKPQQHSLSINCGGSRITFGGNEYEEDLNTEGPSYFYYSSSSWAFSSTGVFMGNDKAQYITSTTNSIGADLYKTARLSPASLRYYGLCLRSGSYKVRLHFAEIMYSDGMTFGNLGRRIFDVLIQGVEVLKDFNIVEAANGTGKGIYKDFSNVLVSGSTLEIQFYWAGKGTSAGVYGPLISAIEVTPNFDVSTGLSNGAIAGIVVGLFLLVVLVFALLRIKKLLGGRVGENKELRALDLQTGYFTLRQLKAATQNFDPANKIGEGGFGPVYKGILLDGASIAVKQLSSNSKQGNREFVTEIGMISALQHPNLVRLYGCCIDGNQLLLIYEYMENNSLARALFGQEEHRLNLDWRTRKNICMGIARGLAYLHEESRLKIVHRDIKATNVLLDKDLNAKISDFGLAKLDDEENTHISTRIAGTIGYMAPEYAMRGYLTDKADVYSFGIVALEIVSGKSNTNYRPRDEFMHLLDWAYVLQDQGNLLELVDSSLGSEYPKEEAMMMLNVALLCTNTSPTHRPSMSLVVRMLEGKIPVQASLIKRTDTIQDARFRAFEIMSQDSQSRVSTISWDRQGVRSTSMDGPIVDESTSMEKDDSQHHSSPSRLLSDLYDVNLSDS